MSLIYLGIYFIFICAIFLTLCVLVSIITTSSNGTEGNKMNTNTLTWNTDQERTINDMDLDTLVLLMDREDQANKGHLELEYQLGELDNV